MRSMWLGFAIVVVLPTTPALADIVRQRTVPESFWGRWAASAQDCGADDKVVAISEGGYDPQTSRCTVFWVDVTPGAAGPFYSAHLRCQKKSGEPDITNVVLMAKSPGAGDVISAGPSLDRMQPYRRCPRS